MLKLFSVVFLSYLVFTMTACGSGGGGGGSNNDTPPHTKTAIITLATAVTGSIPSDTTINGYDIAISLPAGVTVKSSMPLETDAGVVTATGAGSGSFIIATYSAATTSKPGSIRILLASGTGRVQHYHCDVSAGSDPASGDFAVTTFVASGLDAVNSTVDLTTLLSITPTVTIQ